MAFTDTDPNRRCFLKGCLAGLAATAVKTRPAGADPPGPGLDVRAAAGSADWAAVRSQFLLDPGLTYLNTGGLGPSPRPVLDTITREMRELERSSETGHERVREVRRRACALLRCDEDELAITRSTTEGMNAIARGLPLEAGDEVLVSTHEHPGGAMPWFGVARDRGITVRTFEPGDGGDDTLGRVEAALSQRTRVVSVSHVMCTTGLVTPVQRIARLCRDRGVFSVIDGAQAVGMIPVDLHALGCDFYATSGHKWTLGPKGTGLMYVRRGLLDQWRPTYVGAYSDRKFDLDRGLLETRPAARSVEYGTRNTPVILGLGAAIDFLEALGAEPIARHGRRLTAHLRRGLRSLPGVEILTPESPDRYASILTFRVTGDARTAGQWCNALKTDRRIRVRPVNEHGLQAVRVSAHVFNTVAQMDRLISALTELMSN